MSSSMAWLATAVTCVFVASVLLIAVEIFHAPPMEDDEAAQDNDIEDTSSDEVYVGTLQHSERRL